MYCSPEDEVEGSLQDGASLRVETTPGRRPQGHGWRLLFALSDSLGNS